MDSTQLIHEQASVETEAVQALQDLSIEELGEAGASNCFGTLGSAGCPACFGTAGCAT